MRAWLFACACAVSFVAAAAVTADELPASREALRDQARRVLESRCGGCHVGGSEAAVPRALAVYDLAQPEWSAKMSEPQLTVALARRLGKLTPDERAVITRFVAAELQQRRRP